MKKLFVSEWCQLYRYYSKFTSSTYNYTSGKMSQYKFLKKYFQELKAYYHRRVVHK